MLKIRVIAVLIAIVLTLLTIYIVPYIAYYYTSFVSGLSHDQQIWFNWAQAGLGALAAVYGYWSWKKKKS